MSDRAYDPVPVEFAGVWGAGAHMAGNESGVEEGVDLRLGSWCSEVDVCHCEGCWWLVSGFWEDGGLVSGLVLSLVYRHP